MKEMLRSIAISHPPGKRCSSIRGNSGYRKTDMVSRAIPLSTNARYWSEAVSIAWWINKPAESSAAIIAKEMIPAPPIAKATGKPVMIPPNSVRNTIIRPISIPSNPKIIFFSFLQARLGVGLNGPQHAGLQSLHLADQGHDTCLRFPRPRHIRGRRARTPPAHGRTP